MILDLEVSMNYKKFIFISLCFSLCLNAQSKFLLLMGPSGCGKSTIIRHLKKLDSRFVYISPLTSRPLRNGEIDKIYATADEIFALNEQGKILTINNIYGNYYATPKYQIDKALEEGLFPILDWPVDKLDIMDKYYLNQLYKVYVAPDDIDELQRRLSLDGRDKDGKRFNAGLEELNNFKNGCYDTSIDLKVINHIGRDQEIAYYIYSEFIKSLEL